MKTSDLRLWAAWALFGLLAACGGRGGVDAVGPPRGDAGAFDGGPGSPTRLVLVGRVIDGDTLEVRAGRDVSTPDGRSMDGERIRLLGVDAPEIAHGGQAADCYGDEARRFVEDAVAGRTVELELDETKCRPPSDVARCRGDFGRLLAYVRYVDATGAEVVLNEALLRTGHAVVLRGATRFRHRDSAKYEQLERDAASRGVGLWTCP